MRKLIYLEWARGVAALLVVFHHITLDFPAFYHHKPFDNFFYFGMAGVDFFFVLSGFIIYYIHAQDSSTAKNIKKYIYKRVIRIYPPFLFVSTLLFIGYLLVPGLTDRTDLFDVGFVMKSFLLFPQESPPLLTVSWTLVHEMFFYLLFIVMILSKKIGFYMFGIWAGLIILFNLFAQKPIFPYSFYFSLHNLEFLFGILVAYVLKNNLIVLANKYLSYVFLGAFVLFVLNGINQNYHFVETTPSFRLLVYGMSAAIMIYVLTHIKQYSQYNAFVKLFSLLGAASYSIYLIHVPLLSILHRLALKTDLQSYLYPDLLFLFLAAFAVMGGGWLCICL